MGNIIERIQELEEDLQFYQKRIRLHIAMDDKKNEERYRLLESETIARIEELSWASEQL